MARLFFAGHQAVVEYLLSVGADASIRDSDGKLAVDRAKDNGRATIMAVLQGKKT